MVLFILGFEVVGDEGGAVDGGEDMDDGAGLVSAVYPGKNRANEKE